MHSVIEQLQTKDGLKLHTIRWLPEGDIRAIIVLVHGIGEHTGRYTHVAEWLTDQGYAVYALDHRGHGRSEGNRVDFDRFTQLVDDLTLYVQQVMSSNPDKRVFVYGHSMGALISLLYVLENQDKLAGWVSSATPLDIDTTQPAFVVTLGTLLSKVLPKLHLLALDLDALSRDPAVVAAYKDDPLVYTRPTRLRVGAELIASARYARAQLSRLTLPIFVIHGTADQVTPPSGSERIVADASSEDKTLKLYPNLYHELHNEPEQQQVLGDIVDWLNAH